MMNRYQFFLYCVYYISVIVAGKMKGIAFIKDPDGYWIEILTCDASVKGYGAQ